MMLCRHCRRRVKNRPRGLCVPCHSVLAIREMYAVSERANVEGVGNINGGYDPPPEPTQTLPGTAERLEELARRAEAGVSLWHSGDARRGLE